MGIFTGKTVSMSGLAPTGGYHKTVCIEAIRASVTHTLSISTVE